MNTATVVLLYLLALDSIVFLIAIPRIHRSGNQQYFFINVHKFCSWFYLTVIAMAQMHVINSGFGTQVVFVMCYMYVLNYNFDINHFIQNDPSVDMTEEDKKDLDKDNKDIMNMIEKSAVEKSKAPFSSRLSYKISSYISGLMFSFGILIMVILRKKQELRGLEEMYKTLQIGVMLRKASWWENIRAYHSRIVSNLAFAIVLLSLEHSWAVNIRFNLYFIDIIRYFNEIMEIL